MAIINKNKKQMNNINVINNYSRKQSKTTMIFFTMLFIYMYKFVHNGEVNESIKKGDWKDLILEENDESPGITVGEMLDIITEFYGVDPATNPYLCFQYETKKRIKTQKVWLTREHENEELLEDREIKLADGTTRPLAADDLELCVFKQAGEDIEEDV